MLSGATLVLNRSWAVVRTTTVRRALVLAYRGAARIIETDTFQLLDFDSWVQRSPINGEECVRTVNLRIRVPEVIVLAAYDGMPRRVVPFTRRNLYRRDRYTCQYCGGQPGVSLLTVDHVVPRSRGGSSGWENCVVACIDCNSRKADRTAVEAGLRLLKSPQEPGWSPALGLLNGTRRRSWERFVPRRLWEAEATE